MGMGESTLFSTARTKVAAKIIVLFDLPPEPHRREPRPTVGRQPAEDVQLKNAGYTMDLPPNFGIVRLGALSTKSGELQF